MELKKYTAELWGQDHTFTPYILSAVWGDGKKYVGIAPIMTRPKFYVVQVGSNCDLENSSNEEFLFGDIVHEIEEAVREEFGDCCDEYFENGGCECSRHEVWPRWKPWEGCNWWEMSEEVLRELGIKQ